MRLTRRLPSRTLWVPMALGGGALLLALAGLISWNLAAYGPAAARWLEDATGETELLPQVKNLVILAVRQRPVETADMTPVSHGGMVPYGANAFFEQEVEEAKVRRTMEMMRQAGIRWVRQQIPWERIEPEAKGVYQTPYGSSWDQFDRVVTLAHEYGLELVVRPDLPPAWARSNPDVPQSRPRNLADYGDFLETLARRYQGKLTYYQIWNEPNLYGEWGAVPDAAGYAEMLRMARQRLKAVDPTIVVLSAPLSPTIGTPDGKNESDLTYLQKLYELGAAADFDILSAQGYGLWTGPGNRRTEPGQVNFSRVRLLREIMVRNGDAGKSVWISEMGWNALPADFPGPATHGRVSLEQQARATVTGLERIHAEWPWVGVTFLWHFRRVSDDERNQVMFYYRMVEPDFTPLPVYDAVKQLTSKEPVMRLGAHQEDDWTLSYSPGWTPRTRPDAGLGGFHSPNSAGAAV
ncbi:MAG: cellulase family glycosylhydrolase, partial [Chloroflexi bacterium]|nr:cellulase family glycosylhydrolase [Chloroflexota bacterium]